MNSGHILLLFVVCCLDILILFIWYVCAREMQSRCVYRWGTQVSWPCWHHMFIYIHIYRYLWHMDRVKRIWYLSHMRAAKVQASLHIRAVSPEPPLLTHTSSESRGTFRQRARSLAPLNCWACIVKICHDGMLEDTNSLDGAHIVHVLL